MQRFRFVGIMLFLLLAALGVRLGFLHLSPNPEVNQQVARTRTYEKEIPVRRGNIFDRSGCGNVLAADVEMRDVCAVPPLIVKSNRVEEIARMLADGLGLSSEVVAQTLRGSSNKATRIARYVPVETASELQAFKPLGVYFPESWLRHYPQGEFMCHVLGFVNYEGIGSAGIEQQMDRYLRGSPGLLASAKDASQRELPLHRRLVIPAINGADVCLTVDQNVQYIVEKALDEVVSEHHAKGAWAILQRVHTGEIVAMASRPAYDLNQFRRATPSSRLNRATGFTYEPGSTLKVVAISAALGEGLVQPSTVFDCENGSWSYAGKILRDYHAYAKLTVADGLKKSSNILTAKVALKLGDEKLYKYMRAYGLGDRLGVDLPGEEAGILHSVENWSKVSATRVAIGQGVAVTALQMVGLFGAIANGGLLMRPYVVSQVRGSDGSVLYQAQPEVLSHPISPETATLMRSLLKGVTEEGGTGKRARVEGYEVAGKTGTAQKAVRGGYSQTDYVASFVGFLPADNPEIAAIVVVDEPQPFHTGGVVAGPTFSRIADQAVRCLDIPPAGVSRVARR